MKLRNKKTGEIVELFGISCKGLRTFLQFKDNRGNFKFECNSLAELNEEWEDYEEPKEYWYIEPNGVIARIDEWDCCTESDIKIMKSLDNYFNTREEAEKAVEKLKAWKRLKDIGYSFDGWNVKSAGSEGDHLFINLYVKDCTECEELLNLLFGGEE